MFIREIIRSGQFQPKDNTYIPQGSVPPVVPPRTKKLATNHHHYHPDIYGQRPKTRTPVPDVILQPHQGFQV